MFQQLKIGKYLEIDLGSLAFGNAYRKQQECSQRLRYHVNRKVKIQDDWKYEHHPEVEIHEDYIPASVNMAEQEFIVILKPL